MLHQRANRQPPRVIMERGRWIGLVAETGATPTFVSDPDWPGQTNIPGFWGGPAKLAVFILDARAELGDYDAEMLARCVRERQNHDGRTVYYFPGLELF